MRMPDDGWRYELIDREIRRLRLAGGRHSRVCVSLCARLHEHVVDGGLGHVFNSATGFRLRPGTVRCPDVAFVSALRLERVTDEFVPVAPDLAVEVLSPEDRPQYVLEKVGDCVEAGSRIVWVIDPTSGRAAIYRSPTGVRGLGSADSLDGEDVLPGFSCRLAEILG